jgi:hypothetical protein
MSKMWNAVLLTMEAIEDMWDLRMIYIGYAEEFHQLAILSTTGKTWYTILSSFHLFTYFTHMPSQYMT